MRTLALIALTALLAAPLLVGLDLATDPAEALNRWRRDLCPFA